MRLSINLDVDLHLLPRMCGRSSFVPARRGKWEEGVGPRGMGVGPGGMGVGLGGRGGGSGREGGWPRGRGVGGGVGEDRS